MGTSWTLTKAFLREATEDSALVQVGSVSEVYERLRTIQRGHFELATESGGVVQISSTIGQTSFAFHVPEALDRAQIIAIAEAALELIEGLETVAEIRALLRRSKTSRTDFSRWCPQ